MGVFTVPSVYQSDYISYSNFASGTTYPVQVPISGLSLDGDYIIKGYFETLACTKYLGSLGVTLDTSKYVSGSMYNLYEPTTDYYFVAVSKADVPQILQTSTVLPNINNAAPLYQQTIYVNDSAPSGYTRTGSTFVIDSDFAGDIFVTLNGLALAKNYDYTLSGNVITFVGTILNNDIITIIFSRTSLLTIVGDFINITSTILSGSSNNQGASSVYYNTTTGMYEVYTINDILPNSNVIMFLNGQTLVYNVDFYPSTTNLRRLIMNGDLMLGDVITIVYIPQANVIGTLTQSVNPISWKIATVPSINDGVFTLEYSTDPNFGTYTVSDTVYYQPNVTVYNGTLALTGSVGTNYYYRVANNKSYVSIRGDIISSSAVSEVVNVVVGSNAINSY